MEEVKFVQSIKAFERAGGRSMGKRELLTFEEKLSMTAHDLKATEDDQIILQNNFSKVKNAKYINLANFVLGYFATKGGKNMDNVKKIIRKYKNTKYVVNPEDIVKYSRYWMKLARI